MSPFWITQIIGVHYDKSVNAAKGSVTFCKGNKYSSSTATCRKEKFDFTVNVIIKWCKLVPYYRLKIYQMGCFLNLLKSASPSDGVLYMCGYMFEYACGVWIRLCRNSIVCVEIRLFVSKSVWVSVCVCMLCICVFVLPGCVWLCQAIWSAVWGAHYPLSSAVGSGALSICPSSLSHPSHPPYLSLYFLFLFCFTFLPIFYFLFLLAWSLLCFCFLLCFSYLSYTLCFILNIIQK